MSLKSTGAMGLCQESQLLPSGGLLTISSVGIHIRRSIGVFVGEMFL